MHNITKLKTAYIINQRRQTSIRILMLCAGIASGLTTLKELGYHIEIAHAVEPDETAQLVMKALHPEIHIIYKTVQEIIWDDIKHNNYNIIEIFNQIILEPQ